MARFCSMLSVGMLILTVFTCSTSSQTVDERLQQFTTSFVRKIFDLLLFRFVFIPNLVLSIQMQFKRVVETKVTRLETKNTQLEALIAQKDKQYVSSQFTLTRQVTDSTDGFIIFLFQQELLAAKVAELELSLQNEQPPLTSNTRTAVIHTEEVITVTNGEKDGRWGRLESCPTGSRAVGYQTQNKFEALFEDVDETGLNMLVIFCDDPLQTKISSPVGL